MKHYNTLNDYFKEKYGRKVYKLSISGGMTCPNRDGTLGTRGCIFCSKGGSGEFSASSGMSIAEQLQSAKKRVAAKAHGGAYIAYFQPFSNTYADINFLRKIYLDAIEPDDIVGLSVATRPDCLPDDVLALLRDINQIKPVSVELGLQTIHPATAAYIRRGYETEVYDETVRKLHHIGAEVITHVILGLPGETEEMMLDTVRAVGKVTDGIKLQLLHVLEGTDLADEYRKGAFDVMTMERYAEILCKAIEVLPENVVVHRITGDGDKKSLIAPMWSADKKRVLNYINRVMDERNIVQGSKG